MLLLGLRIDKKTKKRNQEPTPKQTSEAKVIGEVVPPAVIVTLKCTDGNTYSNYNVARRNEEAARIVNMSRPPTIANNKDCIMMVPPDAGIDRQGKRE